MLKHRLNNRQRGFGLLEILVAVVVVSLGLLGFAALQLTGLSANKIAMERTQATILAYDIIDAMRANKTAATANAYDHAIGAASPSSATTADTDLLYWLDALSSKLPSGDGAISVDATSGTATVTIEWDERKSDKSKTSVSVSTRL